MIRISHLIDTQECSSSLQNISSCKFNVWHEISTLTDWTISNSVNWNIFGANKWLKLWRTLIQSIIYERSGAYNSQQYQYIMYKQQIQYSLR